jgi:hypothetical protein
MLAAAATALIVAWFARDTRLPFLVLAIVLLISYAFCALCFGQLTVCDEGECLRVRFGPAPLFGTRIRYAEVTAFAPDRSKFIDGWGIHHIPWRGTTYNIWGYDCVTFDVSGRIVRVGTDDPRGLIEFLKARVPEAAKRSRLGSAR